MKKIAIISPDAVKLPLLPSAPKYKIENDKKYLTVDKCCRPAALGIRAQRFAEYLADVPDCDVTLFIPNLNHPGDGMIDVKKLKYKISTYNWEQSLWQWSEELDRKLQSYDFVIIQTTAGAGFVNCTVLPSTTNVIVDAWIPFLPEFSVSLLSNKKRVYRKIMWERALPQYESLIRRSNCVICANDRQKSLYEGMFFSIGKLNWRAYKFSPILKIPMGMDSRDKIQQIKKSHKMKLLWYGPIYPWYDPITLIEAVKKNNNIALDFVGVSHPRFKNLYNTYYKDLLDKYSDVISIDETYYDDPTKVFVNYDAGITISKQWVEEYYSHRCRIIDMVSSGLPVITNKGNPIYDENDCLKTAIHAISTIKIEKELENIYNNRDSLLISKEDFDTYKEKFKWENVLSPLIEYIDYFKGNK
jgi:hypothetical protein